MLVTVEARHNAVVVGYELHPNYNDINISERQNLLLRWTQVKESRRQNSNCTALSHTGCSKRFRMTRTGFSAAIGIPGDITYTIGRTLLLQPLISFN